MADLANRVVHFEIGADDPERAIKFYTSVFGWDIKKWESDQVEYWMIMTGKDGVKNAINGGLTRRGEKEKKVGKDYAPNAFVNVVEVADTDKTVEAVKKNGGSITVEPMDMPEVGRMAYCIDTEGNHFGVIKSV